MASGALHDAEEIGLRLKTAVGSVARRAPADGAAVEDARARLQELELKLETTLASSLRATGAALRAKEAALNRFTVTLFGRTMAGKSTIREALTRGDGATIGKGAQRTTRDVREYTWNSLRIIDTPGIGAYEGDEDRAQALSVIDETDVVLFLASSDGIQEESFKGMQELRQQNKPLLFVLNVKRDLEKPVNMRRFLKDPRSVFDDNELRGHFDRIHKLAGEYLGMRDRSRITNSSTISASSNPLRTRSARWSSTNSAGSEPSASALRNRGRMFRSSGWSSPLAEAAWSAFAAQSVMICSCRCWMISAKLAMAASA